MRITMAYETKVNGRMRKAGTSFKADTETARALIYRGRARLADPKESDDSTNTKIGKDLIENGEE